LSDRAYEVSLEPEDDLFDIWARIAEDSVDLANRIESEFYALPALHVFAGPNGSGNSTVVARYSFEGKENLLDPDAVAKRINPADPSAAAIEAAREVITRGRQYLKQGQSLPSRPHYRVTSHWPR